MLVRGGRGGSRRARSRIVVPLALLAALAAAFYLFLLSGRMFEPRRPDRRPREPVWALGILRSLPLPVHGDEERPRFGALLKQDKIWPVATNPRLRKLAPEFTVPTQELPTSPPQPSAPTAVGPLTQRDLDDLEPAVTRSVSARCFGRNSGGPLVFRLNYGTSKRYRSIEQTLSYDAAVPRTFVVPSENGRVVLIVVERWPTPPRNGLQTVVYWAAAPDWGATQIVASSLAFFEFYYRGQTPDGRKMYMVGRSEDPDGHDALWEIKAETRQVRTIALMGKRLLEAWLIPSPSGDLLATCPDYQDAYGVQWPLQLVRVSDGYVTDLTWRRKGDCLDTALAWSAKVRNRVYFMDLFSRLWQLDLDRCITDPASCGNQPAEWRRAADDPTP